MDFINPELFHSVNFEGIIAARRYMHVKKKNRRGGLAVGASASWAGGCGFDPRPWLTKVFETGGSSFPPLALRIMGIALRLARHCHNNELVMYQVKTVQDTWICELSPLTNWNTVNTA